jgi:N-acetyl sugar amidotransferase
MDTTAPDIRFDEQGECSYCKLHDKLWALYPVNAETEESLKRIARKIQAQGRGRPHDCVVGVSGGRDTSYCLYKACEVGLRPLAVHFDNGWDSEVSKSNLRRLCGKLGVDLHTIIADWDESRELTNSTIRALVPYIDLTDDVGIASALYRTAAKEGIRWIIYSHSFRAEGINPLKWNYVDARFVRHLIKRFCRVPLKKFQNVDIHHFLYWILIKRIRILTITNFYLDSDPQIDQFLKDEFGWEETGGWHFDNEIFGLQCYYSRRKFGIDWRTVEFSALIRSGVMTRDEAVAKLREIPPIEREEIVQYGLKKQGISPQEFEEILNGPQKYFTDYPSYYPLLSLFKGPIKLLGRMNVLPPYTYEKYFET